ncbi:chromosome segregation protein sudA (DA-box protein sudA) [Spinellus fusiger]|nr:chromosome segregation protein sudA (DA-box protein sudA) [Spinellus fusiger]
MYIKQITIQGFKSYKDQLTIDPFSPNHNVIVGRNGTGKSNFFAAIRFVLGDAYQNLGKEDRQALLHESSGAATISAFVEITFDNADGRFPTGKEEVVLRRSIGLTLDEYSLDRKSVTKSDVMSLLESAGFSRSNPYYIVPQGRVTSLTVAKDEDRLKLLKDIAGTRVYEQKRNESTKIMEDTDAKRVKITEVLDYIQDRLAELEEEKEELSQYHTLDKERRSLEYTIYAREQTDANEKLEEMDENRRRDLMSHETKRSEYTDNDNSLNALETGQRNTKQTIRLLEAEKKDMLEEKEYLMKARAQLELLLKDLEDGQLTETELKALVELTPQFNDIQETDRHMRQQMRMLQTEQQSLHAKQARLSRFASKSERDAWLQSQINDIASNLKIRKNQIQIVEQEKSIAMTGLASKGEELEEIKKNIALRQSQRHQVAQREDALKQSRDEATEKRKTLWRDEAKLDSILHNCNDEIRKAERTLAGSIDKNTTSGLSAVTRITKDLKLKGVYGPIFELFDVDSRFRTAVEVAAGATLFHVVVDTDATATKLMETMNKERSGRVTFIPLNRVKVRSCHYPTANDAIPMLQKLQFDAKYQSAFEQLFSGVIVCPNLEVAASYAKSHNLTVVTLDGDRVDGRGALSGGFIDTRNSRLEAAKNLRTWQTTLEEEKLRGIGIKEEISELDQTITNILGQLQLIAAEKKKMQVQEDTLSYESKLRKEEDTFKELVASKEKSLASISENATLLEQQLSAYEHELRTEPLQTLSREEQARLVEISNGIEQIKQKMLEIAVTKLEIEGQINNLKDCLNKDLKRRREEILSRRNRVIASSSTEELKRKKVEHKVLLRKLGKITKTIEEQVEVAQSINRYEKHLERYLLRRSLLLQKKEECNANIRDLGVLPEEAFEKYASLSVERLLRRLHRANEALQKYNHVNKKAFEQYGRFTKQRDQLTTRKAELDKSAEAIRTLIDSLDKRKDEVIERTFNAVATNFSQVFERLVPAGHAELIIQQKSNTREGDMELDGESQRGQQETFDRYSGVSMKVSFNSKSDEGMIMQQLSGGQKSLVALALIFAIQKCDPAPFYLFDEIDANLDVQYRTAIAEMIHTMSEHAQFITTTFRPELLDNANKFYGVSFQGKVSRIHAISKESALGFVAQERTH